MIGGWVLDLQELLDRWPWWLQCLGVFVAAAVPLIDADFGSAIGVVIGLPVPVAVLCGVAGNTLSMLLVVRSAHWMQSMHAGASNSRNGVGRSRTEGRGRRLQALLSRFGVPGVGLLGSSVAPAHVCAVVLLALGEDPRRVMAW